MLKRLSPLSAALSVPSRDAKAQRWSRSRCALLAISDELLAPASAPSGKLPVPVPEPSRRIFAVVLAVVLTNLPVPTAGVSNVPVAVATVNASPATFPAKATLLADSVADVVPSCILLAAVMPLTLAMLARVRLAAAVWPAARL